MPVQQPNPAPQFVEGKPNAVLAITDVKFMAVAFTDGEGRKSMCLALSWGKDNTDGKAGVFILADENAMKTQLTIANSHIKEGVRRHLAKASATDPNDVGGIDKLDVSDVDKKYDDERFNDAG